MPKFDPKLTELVDRVYATPEGRAYLRTIKGAEGGEYDIMFGGQKIADTSKHPWSGKQGKDVGVEFTDKTGKKGRSTAAGAYQFLAKTWDNGSQLIGAKDFSATNQDRVALALALQKPGMYEAIMNRDLDRMVKLSNSIWTSLPGSVEGAKYHAQRTPEYVRALYEGRSTAGIKPWTNAPRTSNSDKSSAYVPSFYNQQTNRLGSGSFFDRAMYNIRNKTYADPGRVPFEVANTANGSNSVYGARNTDPRTVVSRLFNRDPNTEYGLSYIGNGLRPTISTIDPSGNRVDMIEMANGNLINAVTGERMNANGTIYEGIPVEYLTPDYEAPQNSPEAMEALRRRNIIQAAPLTDIENEQAIVPVQSIADPGNAITGEYNYQGTTGEATLPAGNTPLTQSGSVASPVAYVSPNEALVNALGGDVVTRTLNSSRPAIDNARDLMRLA